MKNGREILMAEWKGEVSAKLTDLDKNVNHLCSEMDDVKGRICRIETKMKVWAAAAGGLVSVLVNIAALFVR